MAYLCSLPLFVAGLFMAGAAPAVAVANDAAALGFDPARLTRLDQTVQRHVEQGHLAGGVVYVARHGRAPSDPDP